MKERSFWTWEQVIEKRLVFLNDGNGRKEKEVGSMQGTSGISEERKKTKREPSCQSFFFSSFLSVPHSILSKYVPWIS